MSADVRLGHFKKIDRHSNPGKGQNLLIIIHRLWPFPGSPIMSLLNNL